MYSSLSSRALDAFELEQILRAVALTVSYQPTDPLYETDLRRLDPRMRSYFVGIPWLQDLSVTKHIGPGVFFEAFQGQLFIQSRVTRVSDCSFGTGRVEPGKLGFINLGVGASYHIAWDYLVATRGKLSLILFFQEPILFVTSFSSRARITNQPRVGRRT